MRIGILGAGNIAGALGQRWAANGHDVLFGVRDPQSYTVQLVLNGCGPNAQAGTMREAATYGDVVALAVPWSAVPDVLTQTGGCPDKILIDCTNRMGPPAPGAPASGAEQVAKLAPQARVVKAFNTLGAESIANLRFGGTNASTFMCGDNAAAKAVVRQLGEDIGFDVVDVGPLATAPLVESLAQLWVQISHSLGRDIAFRLLRR